MEAAAHLEAVVAQQAATIEKLSAEREQFRRLYMDLLERCEQLERGIVAGKKAERFKDAYRRISTGASPTGRRVAKSCACIFPPQRRHGPGLYLSGSSSRASWSSRSRTSAAITVPPFTLDG